MKPTQPGAVTAFSQPGRCCFNWLLAPLLLTATSCQSTPDTTAVEPTSPIALPSSSSPTAPPLPPANSYLAQLPPKATNQLTALDVDIVIPTYLPANMKLANHSAGETEGNRYYWLVYRDEQNRCFAIEYASTNINDISLENKEPLNSNLFGNRYSLYHGKFPNGSEGELSASDLFTDWLEGEDGFYRLVGAGIVTGQDYGQTDCVNITVQEAIAVAESLGYLPNDIRTLDFAPTPPEDAR